MGGGGGPKRVKMSDLAKNEFLMAGTWEKKKKKTVQFTFTIAAAAEKFNEKNWLKLTPWYLVHSFLYFLKDVFPLGPGKSFQLHQKIW